MDYLFEKIAGSGPTKRHNLAKCRKELEQSCINYERHANRLPPTPQATPHSFTSAQHDNTIERDFTTKKRSDCQTPKGSGHTSRTIKTTSIEYIEADIRQKASDLKNRDIWPTSSDIPHPPSTQRDVLDGYRARDFANDFCVDNATEKSTYSSQLAKVRPQKRSASIKLTVGPIAQEDMIKKTANRIASCCKVRDKEPYLDSPPQEALHRLRTEMWKAWSKAHIGAACDDESPSSDTISDNSADNGVRITTDGCIVQSGFDLSPSKSSCVNYTHKRVDSGIQTNHETPGKPLESPQRGVPVKSTVRNSKGQRIPLAFRKRELPALRKNSALTDLHVKSVSARKSEPLQQSAQKNQYHTFVSQQRNRTPVPAKPVVFFTGSPASDAIASDSDDGSEDEAEDTNSSDWSSVTGSTAALYSEDDAEDRDSDGSVVTVNTMNESAKLSKATVSLEPTPKIPARQSPQALVTERQTEQTPSHVGEPRPQQPSKSCRQIHQKQIQGDIPHLERVSNVLCSLSRQETAGHAGGKRFEAPGETPLCNLEQKRSIKWDQSVLSKVPHPRLERKNKSCPTLSPQTPTFPNRFHRKTYSVSALLAKNEENGGVRPPNFSWDHVAPMHGFSISKPFFVLD